MDAICTAARETFRHQEAEYRRVIAGLPNDALNWRPGPETNSLAVLVAHAWGAAQAWTARASGQEIARDREAEFRAVMTAEELSILLDRASERVAAFLSAIDPAAYEGIYTPDPAQGMDGETFTHAHCLIHALEHTQEHLGQAYLTRQLWEQCA